MKLILAQPSVRRFQWELEVLLTNIKQFGDFEVILLFTQHDNAVPRYLTDKYGVRCFVYADERDDTSYIPSVRPWLLWKYLSEDPAREQEQYFYIDSDIIFREWPDLHAEPGTVVGSNCDGYIGYDYIKGRIRGDEIAAGMAEITGITVDQMKGVPGIGAHLILTNPTAEFWQRSYQDSNRLFYYFQTIDTDLQKWTAEMWAQLWGWVREGQQIIMPAELDFCRPTDDLPVWDTVKIMHNAGVVGPGELFFKGSYTSRTPFGDRRLRRVRPDKVSIKYVEAIQRVVR